MRNNEINRALEASLSRERLEKYLEVAGGDLDHALTLYERNTRLAEAFYSPLQSLEVCLRNGLNARLMVVYGGDWLENGTPPLDPDARDEIAQALRSLPAATRTQGQVIAELRFGFWVGLLGPRYDATLWRKALHMAFRARTGVKRSVVHGRLNALRRFRNRVAHHEPVFHRPIETLHAELLEAIGWMCRDTAAWAEHNSRFPAVYAGQIA